MSMLQIDRQRPRKARGRTLVDEDRDPDVPSSRKTLPQKASSDFYPNHVHTVVETGGRPGMEGGLWSKARASGLPLDSTRKEARTLRPKRIITYLGSFF